MPNELEIGAQRQGRLVDFDKSTPEVTVTLQRSEEGIRVSIPWSDYSSPYARWFVNPRTWSEDSGPALPTPKRLLFEDSHGSLQLVGCWSRGYHTTIFGPGSGTVWARYALLDVKQDVDFLTANGLRSEVTGLRSWLGIRSVGGETEYQSVAPYQILRTTAQSASPVEVLDGARLNLIPYWTEAKTEDSVTITDRVLCETRAVDAEDWASLEKTHLALRDLLVLSQWRREVARVVSVLRTDDAFHHRADDTTHDQWRAVVTGQSVEDPEPVSFRRHLISFKEIGLEGLRKWLSLRDEFARALDPIISTCNLRNVSPMTMLAQTGPGIEALGYLLMLRDGATKREAADASLEARLRRVLKDIWRVIPFDGDNWVAGTVRVYNGLKHANRAAPEMIDLLNRWQETVLAVRAWVAIELGTPGQELTERLKNDDQAAPWEAR